MHSSLLLVKYREYFTGRSSLLLLELDTSFGVTDGQPSQRAGPHTSVEYESDSTSIAHYQWKVRPYLGISLGYTKFQILLFRGSTEIEDTCHLPTNCLPPCLPEQLLSYLSHTSKYANSILEGFEAFTNVIEISLWGLEVLTISHNIQLAKKSRPFKENCWINAAMLIKQWVSINAIRKHIVFAIFLYWMS